jgi:phosphoribosylformylglycinamidine synthase I
MQVTVVVFPGTNCEHDVQHLYGNLLGARVKTVWHRESDIGKPDLVVLPGGFSYGDYLRTGALAKLSPVMRTVIDYANKGGNVVGICNGFQILCESGLLPGVLLQNKTQKFASKFINIKVDSNKSFFTKNCKVGDVITCPVAHFDGNYFADSETLKKIEDNNQVVFRYCSADGVVDANDATSNFNGSVNAIAGVSNEKGNVVGFMPHPERAAEKNVGWIGSDSGMSLFR